LWYADDQETDVRCLVSGSVSFIVFPDQSTSVV
jgi:hypothetical protein